MKSADGAVSDLRCIGYARAAEHQIRRSVTSALGTNIQISSFQISESCTEKCRMQLVARDGIDKHYTSLVTLPLSGIYLYPAA